MTGYIKLCITKAHGVIDLSRTQIIGIFLLIFGILSIIWTPYELVLNERLRMRPGLPPFEWWLKAPDATLKVYVYNITNADRFLNGEDPKLIMEEVGPILYREEWNHRDVVFNDNDTMSYVHDRKIIYAEDDNHLDLNATLVVPNMAILTAISSFWDKSIFVKQGLNVLIDIFESKPIIQTTLYNMLHNNRDPLVDMAHNLLPSFVPIHNLGIIDLLLQDHSNNITAFIGTSHGHELYSLIDNFNGGRNIPGHTDSCKVKIVNASEGLIYPQMITKRTVLRYYRNCICRIIHLKYDSDSSLYGTKTYKFVMPPTELNRIHPPEDDCFDSHPSLPNGISDVSKCYHSNPITVSYVYFDNVDESFQSCVDFRLPNGKTAQPAEFQIEPVTGIQLRTSAALQVNLNVRPLNGFSKKFDKFSDQIIPVFWLHYFNDKIPFKFLCLIHLILALPIIGWILTSAFFLASIYCFWKSVKRKSKAETKSGRIAKLDSSIPANVELETFLKEQPMYVAA